MKVSDFCCRVHRADPRRNAEEKARREADEARVRRNAEEAKRQAGSDPQAREERALAAASSSQEIVERVEPRSAGTAHVLWRHWAKILAAALAVGGVVVLISYLTSLGPDEAAITNHLPDDLRASCTAADKAATCYLEDGTVVLYKLFDTAAEAKDNVSNGQPIEPDGDPCPPQTQPTVDIVCWYTVESHKGLAMFSHTEKDNLSFFISRWVSNAEPRLRGEMSTETAEPQDWTTLKANWTRLVTAK